MSYSWKLLLVLPLNALMGLLVCLSRPLCRDWSSGGPEGPCPPPPAGAKCLRFWAKCPSNLDKMPPFAPKCPTNLGKMPSICQQSAPVSFRPQMHHLGGKFSKFSGGGPPDVPNILLTLCIFHLNANWAAQHARVMCPLISLAPPARIFWISPWSLWYPNWQIQAGHSIPDGKKYRNYPRIIAKIQPAFLQK